MILDRATRRDGLPGVLVQRDTELSRLSRLVKAVRQGEPAVTMVVGAPGTGRTSLLAHAVRVAHDNGVQVMAATGAETESGLRYGVVSQLLAAEPDQAARDLLRRLASSDETVIPVLCGYFVARSRRVPLLVVIDDVHLADEQSRLWLQAMARRLNGTSTMLLLSGNSMLSRLPADPAWSFAGSMQASRRHHHVIRSSPLDEDGVREIVGRQRGHAPSDLIKRLADSTLGNPAVLSAVLARLTGPERESQAVALAHGIRRERTQILLAQLSPDLLSLLKGIAVAGRVLAAEHLPVLVELGSVPLSTALGLLRDYGLIHNEDDRWVTDEVVTQCVQATMGPDRRADLHTAAAELAHRLASADDDVAALLLGATPVNAQWAADVLCAAANNRVGRSNAHDPARFLRRALLEPVSAAKRAELLVKLADTTTAGRPEAGDLRLTRVLLDDSGCQTASARLAAADLMLINGAGEVTRQMLGAVYRQPGVTDSERAAIAAWCWLADDFCHSGRDTALPDFPAGNDDPDLAGIAAWRTAVHGKDAAGARRLARRALATAGNVDRLLLPRLMAARTLMLTDDAVEATAGIDQVLVDARRRGLPSAVSLALLARVQLNHRRGWSTEAAEDLSTALAELPLHRWHPAAVPMALGFQSLIWLEQGRLDCAARAAGTPLPPAAEQGAGMSYLLFARGLTHLTAGRFEQAVLDLQECGRRMLYKGWHNPAATPWRSLAALAHLACGRQEESDRLFNEDWRLAQQWGTSSVLGLISLWHGKALEGEPAWRKLSFAVRTLRDSPARGWYAGALYKLAAHQAVAGDEQTAEVLLSDCERLDAMQEDRRLMGNVRTLIWRLRVSRRLADVGGRQLPLAGIGERITQMVALGVSTSEIAEALSISRRSAEQHLTTIYRAFGVNGRAELRAVLSNREAVPGKSRNVGEVSRL